MCWLLFLIKFKYLKEKKCIDYYFQYNLYHENDICSEECDLYKKSEIRGKEEKECINSCSKYIMKRENNDEWIEESNKYINR